MKWHWEVPALALSVFAYSNSAGAWLFHEHTAIGRTAVGALPREESKTLTDAWTELRADSKRLCAELARPDSNYTLGPGQEPPSDASFCADFAMIPAVAGDFSCAPDDLWESVTRSDWLPKIARAAHETEVAIVRAKANASTFPVLQTPNEKIREAWHDNHYKNFVYDPGYLGRARGNVAHFLWPRQSDDLDAYLKDAFVQGRSPNAAAFWAAYHISAVRFAHRAAAKEAGSKERRELLRWMFFSEATALHYLEDGFSAGHAVGRAGDSRDRTGTHDYYCENGIEGRVWPEGRGDTTERAAYVAHGDAFMSTEDQRHAAVAVRMSLRDVARTLAGSTADREILSDAFAPADKVKEDTMDACVESFQKAPALDMVPKWLAPAADDGWIWSVLRLTMMPSLARTKDEIEPHTTLPVFPTEVGAFVGAYAAGRTSVEYGLNKSFQKWRFPVTGEGGVEAGFGGNGLATDQTDAILLLTFGALLQSAELEAPLVGETVLPSRFGFTVRARVPFRYVPFAELVYTIPAVIFGSNRARAFFVEATEAGFFGIERRFSTPLGSFQIVALREIAFRYLTMSDGTGAAAGIELPLLEVKPQPWYAASTGNSFVIQLGVTADFGQTTRSVGAFLRLGLDTRRYLSLTL